MSCAASLTGALLQQSSARMEVAAAVVKERCMKELYHRDFNKISNGKRQLLNRVLMEQCKSSKGAMIKKMYRFLLGVCNVCCCVLLCVAVSDCVLSSC
jgi:hypothetical protein